MYDIDLNETQLDALREIGNIGIGNAVTSLAQLINHRINMKVPKACFLDFEKVIELVGGYEELVSCVGLRLLGDIPGMVLFVFSELGTYSMVDMLMGLEVGSTSELDDMGQSAVKEVGNVLTGSFISAISKMSNMRMVTTVPIFAFDMLGAVLTSFMIASGRVEDKVLVIETELFQELDSRIKGHFFLLTEPGSIQQLFASLGITVENNR